MIKNICTFFDRYDMEMQMIHVNMKYINKDGSFDEGLARNNTNYEGFAIISVMFERQDSRYYGVGFSTFYSSIIITNIKHDCTLKSYYTIKILIFFFLVHVTSGCKFFNLLFSFIDLQIIF